MPGLLESFLLALCIRSEFSKYSSVSYTHLTLPTNREVEVSVVAGSLKKKKMKKKENKDVNTAVNKYDMNKRENNNYGTLKS